MSIKDFWNSLPMFPWEGPPVSRKSGLTWDNLRSVFSDNGPPEQVEEKSEEPKLEIPFMYFSNPIQLLKKPDKQRKKK